MRRFIVVGTVVLMTTGLTTACATKGQLRELQATQKQFWALFRAELMLKRPSHGLKCPFSAHLALL